MDVYLLDGTYELFRHYYAMPSARDARGQEVGAVRGVLHSVLGMRRLPSGSSAPARVQTTRPGRSATARSPSSSC